MTTFKIGFAGTPDTAATVLKHLHARYPVCCVLTAPDKKKGRGQKLQMPPVKQVALENNIPVCQPSSLKSLSPDDILPELDILIVVAYGQLLPKAFLDYPAQGCLNIHYSLLPEWRGASPIQQAILAKQSHTGISLMKLDEGLDTGPVYIQRQLPLQGNETTESLGKLLTALACRTLDDFLPDICLGQCHPQAQQGEPTHAGKITKQEACILWEKTAKTIAAEIRAFYPWPISFSFLEGKRIRLLKAEAINIKDTHTAGTIIKQDIDSIDIQTGEGVIRLHQAQLDGGKPLSIKEIQNAKSTLFSEGKIFTNEP